jgi:hypothetical protein
MTRNITLRLDEAVVRRCRQVASREEKSVSQWVTDLILDTLAHQPSSRRARVAALRHLEVGLDLGGHALPRDKLHER